MLKFSNGNAKLKGIFIFNLPAGWSCPFASACAAKTDPTTGKLSDGQFAQFRCYAAMQEATYSPARRARWRNFNLLKNKSKSEMAALIEESLPTKRVNSVYRVHSSGDFFNQNYFDAWMEVAKRNPRVLFYAYTKALPLWIARQNSIPANFILTASWGGTHDFLIEKHNLRSAQVVDTVQAAAAAKLPIDHDDSHAMSPNIHRFALLIHGAQKKGTKLAKLSRQHALNGLRYGHPKRKVNMAKLGLVNA